MLSNQLLDRLLGYRQRGCIRASHRRRSTRSATAGAATASAMNEQAANRIRHPIERGYDAWTIAKQLKCFFIGKLDLEYTDPREVVDLPLPRSPADCLIHEEIERAFRPKARRGRSIRYLDREPLRHAWSLR